MPGEHCPMTSFQEVSQPLAYKVDRSCFPDSPVLRNYQIKMETMEYSFFNILTIQTKYGKNMLPKGAWKVEKLTARKIVMNKSFKK